MLLTNICSCFLDNVCGISCVSPKVTALCDEADRLESAHPDSAPEIQSKKDEIANNWENLRSKVSGEYTLLYHCRRLNSQ